MHMQCKQINYSNIDMRYKETCDDKMWHHWFHELYTDLLMIENML